MRIGNKQPGNETKQPGNEARQPGNEARQTGNETSISIIFPFLTVSSTNLTQEKMPRIS